MSSGTGKSGGNFSIGFVPPGVDYPQEQKPSSKGAPAKVKSRKKLAKEANDNALLEEQLKKAAAAASGQAPAPEKSTKRAVAGNSRGKHEGPGNLPVAMHRDAFCKQFEQNFFLPKRLFAVPSALVEAVNDFHFAMMNDLPRNDFYYQTLKKSIVPGVTGVLEIGAGSGLLSMMAATLGAKWVVAVEGSPEMAQLARKNILKNSLQDKVTVLNMLSTELTVAHLPDQPDVIVSEILGTLLLGESALDYLLDIRQRGNGAKTKNRPAAPINMPIMKPTTRLIPPRGTQYAVPISCEALTSICSVSSYKGIDLSGVNELQDTASVVFTKKFGFRLSTVPFKRLSAPIALLPVDFERTVHQDLSQESFFEIDAIASGPAHAIMYYWVVEGEADVQVEGSDGTCTTEPQILQMSTAPEDNIANFPRDMQWGQALQLLDDGSDPNAPTPPVLQEGMKYRFLCHLSHDHVVMQMQYGGQAGSSAACAV